MQKYILKEKSLQELTILELFSLVADTKNLLSEDKETFYNKMVYFFSSNLFC